MSFAHAVSGNSLHNFVLENLFVYDEIAGIGRTPWRSMGERYGVAILRLALPFASSGSCSLRKTEGYCIQPNLDTTQITHASGLSPRHRTIRNVPLCSSVSSVVNRSPSSSPLCRSTSFAAAYPWLGLRPGGQTGARHAACVCLLQTSAAAWCR